MCAVAEAAVTRTKLLHLFQDLRRRNVFKVVAGYAVCSWIVIQLASIVVPALELPAPTVLVVIAIMVVGLPIAIVLGWSYDLTPGGLHLTTDADSLTALDAPSPGKALAAVAVLPFARLTPNAPHAYLADAIPLELQSLLSRLHDLRVVSRQSAVARAGSDLRTIARELSAQYVISGSVTELGELLRIDVQLDDAAEDTLLWCERYDVAAKDIDTLQREISEKVVGTFGGERMRAEVRRANEATTTATNAGQLVQKARTYLLDYTPTSVAAAIPLLRRAVELDPAYAIGYATLGLVTAEKTLSGISADVDSDRRFAITAVERAEKLAPRDPVVLRAVGCVLAYTGSYTRALEILRRAVKLAPYDLGTWGYLGWPLTATGKADDLEELQQIMGRLLNTSPQHPGRVYWLFHKSVAYTCADDCERAAQHAQECITEQPRFSLGWMNYANILGRLGRREEAVAAVERCLDANPLMTVRYYADLMAKLTDQPSVVAKRTAGLSTSGLLAAASPG